MTVPTTIKACVLELADGTRTSNEIAKILGLRGRQVKDVILRQIHETGVPRSSLVRYEIRDRSLQTDIERLHAEGLSVREIAVRLGKTKDLIRHRLYLRRKREAMKRAA